MNYPLALLPQITSANGNVLKCRDGRLIIDMISGIDHATTLGWNCRPFSTNGSYPSCLPNFERDSLAQSTINHLRSLNSHYSEWTLCQSQDHAVEIAILHAIERRLKLNGKCARKILYATNTTGGRSIGSGFFSNDWSHLRRPYDIIELPFNVLEGDNLPASFLHDFDAILIEPVQYRTGYCFDKVTFERLRAWCNTIDASLIVNESYTCLGRCGAPGFLTSFGHTIILGSSIAQGITPFGAVGFSSSEFAIRNLDCPPLPPSYMACHIANEVLHTFKTEMELSQRATQMGELFSYAFTPLKEQWDSRITGGMIYLRNKTERSINLANTLLIHKSILTTVVDDQLVLMPALTTPLHVIEDTIQAIISLNKW